MWNKEKLDYLINNFEENKLLDYKAAKALNDNKEISKDVSSFANSEGGVIIYGIAEDPNNKIKLFIDPINRKNFPKERLENIITSSGNISPTLQGVKIFPIVIDEIRDLVVYVVEIPKGNTAYQAFDNRYYFRYNFGKKPMEDWQVKDVINRANKPIIEITLIANTYSNIVSEALNTTRYEIDIILQNSGNLGVQHIECFVEIDSGYDKYLIKDPLPIRSDKTIQIPFNNRVEHTIKIDNKEIPISVYNQPLLPTVWRVIGRVKVRKGFYDLDCKIKCHVSTEYGLTSKEFQMQEILNKES